MSMYHELPFLDRIHGNEFKNPFIRRESFMPQLGGGMKAVRVLPGVIAYQRSSSFLS